MMSFQISAFEPNLFSFFEVDRDEFLFGNLKGLLGFISGFSDLS
jgi:hypothetical protein